MNRASFKSWKGYQTSYRLANEIFRLSIQFPKEEKYSLTDQIRRSSRAVSANMAEAAAKRRYSKHFVAKLTDSAGENYETQVWLDFAKEYNYISEEQYQRCCQASESIAKLINYMIAHPTKFGCHQQP